MLRYGVGAVIPNFEMAMTEPQVQNTKAIEARARGAASRLGWRVEKSRTRNHHANDQGAYQLIDDRNTAIEGWHYDASLETVVARINEERLSRHNLGPIA